MWCDLGNPSHVAKRWNCKIKEINIIILMFFFIFYGLWTSVTFINSIRGDPSKTFWKESNSNFHMISITQNINFVPCDRFSQITSHIWKVKQQLQYKSTGINQLAQYSWAQNKCNLAWKHSRVFLKMNTSRLLWCKICNYWELHNIKKKIKFSHFWVGQEGANIIYFLGLTDSMQR